MFILKRNYVSEIGVALLYLVIYYLSIKTKSFKNWVKIQNILNAANLFIHMILSIFQYKLLKSRIDFKSALRFTFLFIGVILLTFSAISQQKTQQNNRTDTTIGPLKPKKIDTDKTKTEKFEIDEKGYQNDEEILKTKKTSDSILLLEKKIFGYSIFHNVNVNFTPNLNMATPVSYVVGPGDELKLQVYGVAQSSYTLKVSPEGSVTIPDIGISKVSGFSIDAVKTILQNKLAIRYAGMGGTNPTTFLEVTLGNLRTIKINVVGEVETPGTYNLPSYVNVFNALFAAGGPTLKGTFRHVQVYRAGKLKSEIDIYDFLVNGKTNQNIRLEDDDVLLVRPATNRIEIEGEVRTPGIFEFKEKETFSDIIKFSGGFSDKAYKDKVNLIRNGITEKQLVDLYSNQFGKANLNDGDLYTVGLILDRITNRVQISGSVFRPGRYSFTTGMKVKDLIQKAEGLKGDAFLKRAILYRTKPDFKQEIISLDLNNINDEKSAGSILLEREDVIHIASVYDIQEEYYVQISGEVNQTGVYPYGQNMTLGDLILKAGGFKYSASGSFIEIVKRSNDENKVAEILTVSIDKNLNISEENKSIILTPFDHIYIRNIAGFTPPISVSIQGEIQHSGVFAIDKKEMRVSDLLKRAGGLTKYAYPEGTTLLRRTKNFISPSQSERENNYLVALKENLLKNEILSESESNKEIIKRIDIKISQNNLAIAKEVEKKEQEKAKQEIFKENTSILTSNNSTSFLEKEQELVAINLDEIIAKPGSNADLVLKEGDIINVPEKLETVSIKGGVLFPVSVRYEPNRNFKEYIERSGGYSSRAIKDKSYVLQANGRVETVKSFLFFKSYPKILPGAEIFVPSTLVDKPPFNYAQSLGFITGLITSTLTLIILLRTL